MASCEPKYTTLLDLARQSKIITGNTACLDGKIQAGLPFSGYPTGPDLTTMGSLGVVSTGFGAMSGNSITDFFDVANPTAPGYNPIFDPYSGNTWTNPLFQLNVSGMTLPIAPTGFTADQTVGPFWTLTQTGMTGDHLIGTEYTGYTIQYIQNGLVGSISGGTYPFVTGFTTAIQENFSAGTLDYKGPVDYLRSREDGTIDNRLTTKKLRVTGGASASTIGYVLTQVDEIGSAEWVFNSASASTNTFVVSGLLNGSDQLELTYNTGGSVPPIDLSALSGDSWDLQNVLDEGTTPTVAPFSSTDSVGILPVGESIVLGTGDPLGGPPTTASTLVWLDGGDATINIAAYNLSNNNNEGATKISGQNNFGESNIDVSGGEIDINTTGSTIVLESDGNILIDGLGDLTSPTVGDVLSAKDTSGRLKWVPSTSFTGGTGSCITDLFVTNIHGCSPILNINPLDEGDVFFGSTSGVTIDVINKRIGVNISPEWPIDILGADIRLLLDDSGTIKRALMSGGTTDVVEYAARAPMIGSLIGGVSIGSIPHNAVSSGVVPQRGTSGDTYLYSSANANGLNIISETAAPTEDYIRFYAGQNADGTTADIHLQGTGADRGNVGINTETPEEKLHVKDGDILIENGNKFITDLSNPTYPTVRFSGSSSILSQIGLTNPDAAGINIGYRGLTEVGTPTYGNQGDAFVYSSVASYGLNLISAPGSGTADYIRLYAGQHASGTIADMFIGGTGTTRGFVGIGTESPEEKLHVQDGSAYVKWDHNDSTYVSVYNLNTGTDARAGFHAIVNGESPVGDSSGIFAMFGTGYTGTAGFAGIYLPNSLSIATGGGADATRAHVNIGSRRTDGQIRFFTGDENYGNDTLLGIWDPTGLTLSGDNHTYHLNTDTIQVRNGATTGHILTATDNLGNASWQLPTFTGNTSGDCIDVLWVSTISGCSPVTIGSSINSISSTVDGISSIAYGDNTLVVADNSNVLGGVNNQINEPSTYSSDNYTLSFSASNANTIDISYTATAPLSALQVEFINDHGNPVLPTITGVTDQTSGTIANVIFGDNIVISFSIIGTQLPAGSGMILSVEFDGPISSFFPPGGDGKVLGQARLVGDNTVVLTGGTGNGGDTTGEGVYDVLDLVKMANGLSLYGGLGGASFDAWNFCIPATSAGNMSGNDGIENLVGLVRNILGLIPGFPGGGPPPIDSFVAFENIYGGTGNSNILGGEGNTINTVNASIIGGEDNIVEGPSSSIIGSTRSYLSGPNSVILGGDSISGTSENTVYVPTLNISKLCPATGGTYTNLLVDDKGYVVTGDAVSGGSGTFTGNTSGDCINILWVSTISGCSPVTIGSSIQSSPVAGISSTATGVNSIAYGYGCYATEGASFALGIGINNPLYYHQATAAGSVALGQSCWALGGASIATGAFTAARGLGSHAEGVGGNWGPSASYSGAVGDGSHTEGLRTNALGLYSHAEGALSHAYGDASHAEGASASYGEYSHSEGGGTAYGDQSHAEGGGTAYGATSHAEGTSIASGITAHAEGSITTAIGDYSHAEGVETTASGEGSHAEGKNTVASGFTSHVEGADSVAGGDHSHAEGEGSKALGDQSHAEGNLTTASADNAHAEGTGSEASGNASHAEGRDTTAGPGAASHAEGRDTTASGAQAHTEGRDTVASGETSHAQGQHTVAGGYGSHAGGHGYGGIEVISTGEGSFAHFTIEEGSALLIPQGAQGDFTAILGGRDNNIEDSATDSAIIGGQWNTIDNTVYGAILGGSFNNITGGTGSSNYNTIVGGFHNNMGLLTTGTYNIIAGGNSNYITETSVGCGIFGGVDNEIDGGALGSKSSIILGGTLNNLTGPSLGLANSENNVIIGGSDNNMDPSADNDNNTIINGVQNDIGGRTTRSAIMGGFRNKIDANGSTNCVIIGGTQNWITTPNLGITDSVILGGTFLTAFQSNTVFVPILNIDTVNAAVLGAPNVNLSIDNNNNAVSGFSWSDPSVMAGNTNPTCIAVLHANTITPCSPLTISPGNEGNVHIGEQGGAPLITLDIDPDEPGVWMGEDSFIRWKGSEKKLIIGEKETDGKVVIEVEEDEIIDITKEKTKIVEGDLETEDGDIIVKSGNSKTVIIEDLPDVAAADLGTNLDGKIIDEPSDSRVKENPKPLHSVVNVLEFIKNVKGYQFTWSEESRIGDPNKLHYGFMVDHFRDDLIDPKGQNFSSDHDNCNQIAKSMVRPNRTKFKIGGNSQPQQVDSLSYTEMIPFIVEGLKEVDFKVENLTLGALGVDVFVDKGEYDDINKTIILTLNDAPSTQIVIPVEDLVNTNNYVSKANLLNDVLTLEREGLSDLNVDLASLKYKPEVRKYVETLVIQNNTSTTINHNLNDEDVIVQVQNDIGELIIPDKIHKYQTNSVVIEVSITGKYKIIILR